jgi:hypothetical protein
MRVLIKVTDTKVVEKNFVLDDIEKAQGMCNEALFIIERGDDPKLAEWVDKIYPLVWYDI